MSNAIRTMSAEQLAIELATSMAEDHTVPRPGMYRDRRDGSLIPILTVRANGWTWLTGAGVNRHERRANSRRVQEVLKANRS